MYIYKVIEGIVYDEENNAYKVYGISASNEKGEVIKSYDDVFFEEEEAIKLVKACNDGKLSVIHLEDVIEDALT